ncbi:ATPase [Tabrizicola sp. TH137]|uniref:ExeA family protein n=1 Tax=Tabrizicola sp. TH137 TaxID=2067452 RepID=UPI000C7AC7AD|nr:AAA family ATPase [Tabrizicola sp. TH137]PLL10760.1 ATPase [Tabrizicola sp. TH137]
MGNILDIYTDFYGLNARPFAIAPDPELIYWSSAHKRAYSLLEYGIITRAPITLITGEVGSGKTVLIQHLLRAGAEDVTYGLVSNAQGGRDELLRWVLLALGQGAEPGDTYVDLYARFEEHLVAEYAAGRRVVLVFDEAQNLTAESLEEIRMFTNINTGTDELLQVVLVGLPELRERILRPGLRAIAQRVTAAFHIPPMDAATTAAYIAHRLACVGGQAPMFTPEAVAMIHDHARGVPRLTNQLCDFAMVYAFSKGSPEVDRVTVSQVLRDGVFFAGIEPAAISAEEETVRVPMFRAGRDG